MNETTERIWLFWLDYCKLSGGTPPTYQNILDGLGISSKSVVEYHVHRLVEAGRLKKLSHNRFTVVGAKWQAPLVS